MNQLFACALTASHDVFCWGGADDGELAIPDASGPVAPTKIVGLPNDVIAIRTALSEPETCAVTASGPLYCWGSKVPNETVITAHAITAGGADVVVASEATLGNGFGCVRRSDGSVACWGENSLGERGQRTCDLDASAPEDVVGVPKATALSSRWNHMRFSEATATSCWGISILGALGTGSINGPFTCNVLPGAPPAVVPNLPPIVAIAAGNEITFAVDQTGKVWAWGDNDTARLAAHAEDRRRSPRTAATPTTGRSAIPLLRSSKVFRSGTSALTLDYSADSLGSAAAQIGRIG